jgi:CRP-like cAMP-binding protein
MLRLCSRFGEKLEDGTVRLPAFTQELLGKCVGTSREIITLNMNELRRQGYVRYSRKNIFVYEDALKENYRLAK